VAKSYGMVKAFNLFPRTFFEVWLGATFVLTKGDIQNLGSHAVKTGYIIAAMAAIAYAACCLLIHRMTLMTSLFLVFALSSFSSLISLTFHGQISPAQPLLTGIASTSIALLLDSLIAKIRSR